MVVDEAGERRWQDDGVADDRQVVVIRVVVEVVGGEFDDVGQWEGVEVDEGGGEANDVPAGLLLALACAA